MPSSERKNRQIYMLYWAFLLLAEILFVFLFLFVIKMLGGTKYANSAENSSF